MNHAYLLSRTSKISLLLPFLLFSGSAQATQPLSEFLAGAHGESFEARETRATAEQRSWEAEAARGRLLPTFTARGIYTHNQFEAALPPGVFPGQTEAITITPQNQFDATFTLDIPLVDLANHSRFQQAKHFKKAAELGQEAANSELDAAVAQFYFTYLGAEALLDASERSLKSAEDNLNFITARAELGAATDLDRQRASANVERSKQDVADAELLRVTAARNLETLTGISVTRASAFPMDDLEKEAPLQRWLEKKDTPQDRVQAELLLAQKAAKRASAHALFPTLSASAQERISNATGFAGQSTSYSLSAVLTWRLDYTAYATARAQASAAEVQAISTGKARRSQEDQLFLAYHRVEANIAKGRAARAQAEAAEKAAELSMERYRAGTITQLDVVQSQRDAFSAQAARIKADADLALSRVLLRIAAGEPASASAPLVKRAASPPPPASIPAAAPTSAEPPKQAGSAPGPSPSPASETSETP